MVPLIVVLTLITAWFFYLRFFISFMKRKKLVWVEVQDFKDPEYPVTRNEAKRNLHMICEMTQKLKLVANLFDKYWYRQREFQYIEGITVEQGAQFSNKDGEQRETNDLAAGARDGDNHSEEEKLELVEDRTKKASMDVNPHVKKLMDLNFKDKKKGLDCGPDVFGLNQMKNHDHEHKHEHKTDSKIGCTDCKDVFGKDKSK